MLTDTHTHIYLEQFKDDREAMIGRAREAGIGRMFLPNIDSGTLEPVFRLSEQYRGICFPMAGLHPTSVKSDYRAQLRRLEKALEREEVIAIGETGIDLYWDTTFMREQKDAFRIQIGWAAGLGIPVVIHARNSFREIFEVLDESDTKDLTGVFHSFTGNREELEKALSYNFMIGINGIVTFKNSGLSQIVASIPPDRLLLETDAPFLAPVPFRGKRNEPGYLVKIAGRVGEIYNLSLEEVGSVTSANASRLFSRSVKDEQ